MALIDGDDAISGDLFSVEQMNRMKNNFPGAAAPASPQQGMLRHDTDDEKFYGYGAASFEEVLQATRSFDRAVQLGMGAQEVKTDDYTVVLGDIGKILVMNAAADKTFDLPSVAAANVGAVLTFVKIGAGRVTIDAPDADTIQDSSAGGTIFNSQAGETWAFIRIRLVSTTAWIIDSFVGTWTTT